MAGKVQGNAAEAIRDATGRPKRPSVNCVHTPLTSFRPGRPLTISIRIAGGDASNAPTSVHLFYRHVNQAERWLSVEMTCENDVYTYALPGDYTNSIYPLQYYFDLQHENTSAWLYPAFNSTLSNQPYYAVSKRIS